MAKAMKEIWDAISVPNSYYWVKTGKILLKSCMFCLVFKCSVGKIAPISFFDQIVQPLAEKVFD